MFIKNIAKKVLSLFLCFVMVFSFTITQAFAQDAETISVDGYVFQVIEKDIKGVTLQYNDGLNDYTFYLDKQDSEGKSQIDISYVDLLSRTKSPSEYKIIFDENMEYTPNTQDFSSTVLVDENENKEYNINPNSRLAFLIPVGIPLIEAAIKALLAVGAAIIIAGVAYTIVEEVAQELRRQKEYRYYVAVLRNNAVYVGGGLQTSSAKSLAYSNDGKGTVLATNFSYAKGLVGNSFYGPENHGSSSGYWSHIHARSGSVRYKAHIWFL